MRQAVAQAASPTQASQAMVCGMTSTYASYALIAANLPKALSRAGSEPVAARETGYYLSKIGSVKTIDDLLGDKRLYDYALKAFGLSEVGYAKALIGKVLQGGVEHASSLANRLSDPRYKEFATAFNFARYGTFTTTFPATGQDVADRYAAQTLEAEAGAQNQAVQLALYFQRKAPSIRSAYSILADVSLLKVVQTALGIDPANARLNIDRQAADIKAKLDVKDLQDPAKLTHFLQRFAARSDAAGFDAQTSPVVTLVGGTQQQGLNADLLLSLQGLKRS